MKHLNCELTHMSLSAGLHPAWRTRAPGISTRAHCLGQGVGGQSRSPVVARRARFRRFEIVRVTESDTHLGVAG